ESGFDDVIQVEQLFLGRHASRKTQEAGHEGLDASREGANLVGNDALAIAQSRVVNQQVGVAQNAGERIIDLVGRACGELADRHQFLVLNHLRLEMLQIPESLAGRGEKPEAVVVNEPLSNEEEGGDERER